MSHCRRSVLGKGLFLLNSPSLHLPGPSVDLVSARSLVPLVLPFATLAVPAFVEVVLLALPPWCFQAPVSLFGQEGTWASGSASLVSPWARPPSDDLILGFPATVTIIGFHGLLRPVGFSVDVSLVSLLICFLACTSTVCPWFSWCTRSSTNTWHVPPPTFGPPTSKRRCRFQVLTSRGSPGAEAANLRLRRKTQAYPRSKGRPPNRPAAANSRPAGPPSSAPPKGKQRVDLSQNADSLTFLSFCWA